MNERCLRVLEFLKIRSELSAYAVSDMGKEKCLSLIPTGEFTQVQRMQEETEEAMVLFRRIGGHPLAPFSDVRTQVKRAALGATLSMRDLLACAETMRASRSARASLLGKEEETDDPVPHIHSMVRLLQPSMQEEMAISNAILSEEEMADSASSELASIRRQMRAANDRIREKLNAFLHSSTLSKYLQEPIITIRGGRYVVPVKAEYRSSVQGLIHDQSASGATLFIEPIAVVETNNDLKQLAAREEAEIERILMQLSALVADIGDALLQNLETLSHLDFLFAKAALSQSMRGVCPKLNQQGFVRILRGRHPLIPKDTVVPSDIWIGKDFSTLIITGPNTGGKTVTLKTIGLFALMTQAGLQIPATFGSEMCVFDEVFADIGDEQSIEQNLSTFSGHMVNIVDILQNVTPNSLALFDELGAGTDPTEGAALAMAILDRLTLMGARTLATTHYSELKAYALSHKGVENASVEFNVESLKPTYRLSIGIPGKSNAFEISRRLGLDEGIITSAREWLSGEQIRFEDVISTAETQRQIAQKEAELAQEAHNETVRLRDEAEKLRRELEEQRKTLLQKAREDARRLVRQTQEESERIIRELRKAKSEQNVDRVTQEARKQLHDKLDSLQDPLLAQSAQTALKEVKPGQTVRILSMDLNATVLSLPDKNGQVQLLAGVMKMKLPLSQLGEVAQEEKTKKPRGGSRSIDLSQKRVALEVDVRGQDLMEALESVDKYLDDCAMAGLKEVTIIHGKGTGTLRTGITQQLRKHPHVESFRRGKYGEGEDGVTVVTLK